MFHHGFVHLLMYKTIYMNIRNYLHLGGFIYVIL